MNVGHINGKLFCYELWILRRNEVWNNVRKTHRNGYMSYVECRMLPINAMVLVFISQLHFTQVKHQSRLQQHACKQSIQYLWVKSINCPQSNHHIRPAWISLEPNSPIKKLNCEVDTGAGCNVMPYNILKSTFGEVILKPQQCASQLMITMQ